MSGRAHVAQLVEHVLGKDEVTRSIRVVGSSNDKFLNYCDSIKEEVGHGEGEV